MDSLKILARKVNIGRKVVRNEGLKGFLAVSFDHLAKRLRRSESKNNLIKHSIDVKARYDEIIKADYTKARHFAPLKADSGSLKISWIMPPPGKGSGGHQNIFRFIKYLEDSGHVCTIYIYTGHAAGKVNDIRDIMGDSYPKINADMKWIESSSDIDDAHCIFSTSWETAYIAYNSPCRGKRFYFVQDFEPLFYPVGSLYVLAENTYRFGFFGITAGGWLASKLNKDYGMRTESFDFGSDSSIYTHNNMLQRKEIFFYARPYTDRRAFELGIMALDLFHQKHPEITINLAGWDVSEYDIPFPYKNLRTLEVSQLAPLYNKCAAALVLSLTNMSLLPLELLGCGTIPVVNEGDNNRMVSNNPYISYAPNNPSALCDALSAVITRKNSQKYSELASKSVADSTWDTAGEKFVRIIEKEVIDD